MKKTELLQSLAISMVAASAAAAPVVTVDGSLAASDPANDLYQTISEGIAAVDAGGTVNVLPGIYNENVFIAKSLSLVGDPGDAAAGPGPDAPIIDGRAPVQLPNSTAGVHIGMQSDSTTVSVSDVTVSGFIIRNIGQYDTAPGTSGEDGIRIDAGSLTVDNVVLTDNRIETTGAASILAVNPDAVNSGLVIRNNILAGNEGGRAAIDVTNTSDVDVDGNQLDSFTNGIVVSAIDSTVNSGLSVENVTVRRNQLTNFVFSAAGTPAIIRVFSEDPDPFSPDLSFTGVSVLENEIDMTGAANAPAAIAVFGPAAFFSVSPAAPQNALILDNSIVTNSTAINANGVGEPLVIRGNEIDFVGGRTNNIIETFFGASVIILENEVEIISQTTGFGLLNLINVTLNSGPVSIIGNSFDGNRITNPEVRAIFVTSPFNPVTIADNVIQEAEEGIDIGDGTEVVIANNTVDDVPLDIRHNVASNASVEEVNNFYPDGSATFDSAQPIVDGADSDGTNLDDDADNDLLSDGLEAALGLDPNNPDTDGDGVEDGLEFFQGTSPLIAQSVNDADNDGLIDSIDPDNTTPDADGDGYQDYYERLVGTDPAVASSAPGLGDVNDDGSADNTDAVRILEVFLGLSSATLLEADTNRDGLIDNVDAVILFNFFVGNIPYLPFP